MRKFTRLLLLTLLSISLGLQDLVAQGLSGQGGPSGGDSHMAHNHSGASLCGALPPPLEMDFGGQKKVFTPRYQAGQHWLETKNGYAVFNVGGKIFYARENANGLVPSNTPYTVGGSFFGGVRFWNPSEDIKTSTNLGQSGIGDTQRTRGASVPAKGTVNTLLIPIEYNSSSPGSKFRNSYDWDGEDVSGRGNDNWSLETALDRVFSERTVYDYDAKGGDDISLVEYFDRASYGQMTLDVEIASEPVTADNGIDYYANKHGDNRAQTLAHEAIRKALDIGTISISDPKTYDKNKDGYIDGVIIMHAGIGAAEKSDMDYVWPVRHKLSYSGHADTKGPVIVDASGNLIRQIYYRGGYKDINMRHLEKDPNGGFRYKPDDTKSTYKKAWVFDDFCIASEIIGADAEEYKKGKGRFAGIGMFAHEFAHMMGLPDLYKKANGGAVGNWGLMSGGAYVGDQDYPSDFIAYSKAVVGWIKPEELYKENDGTTYTIQPSYKNKSNFYQINSRFGQDYFILENRHNGLPSNVKDGQQYSHQGNDTRLPFATKKDGTGGGLLIWHLNERLADVSNRYNFLPNDSEGFSYGGVMLEEADGLDAIKNGDENNRGDSGDPYPGALNNKRFTAASYPNSNSNYTDKDGNPIETGISITDITQNDDGSISFKLNHSETEEQEPNYCQSKPMYSDGLGITQVNFGQLSSATDYKSSYHYDPNTETLVNANDAIELEVILNGQKIQNYQNKASNIGVKAFIDWNADGDFEDKDEEVLSGFGLLKDNNHYSEMVTVPASAKDGSVRYLRVTTWHLNQTYLDEDLTVDDITACGAALTSEFIEGETEDYRVVFTTTPLLAKPINLKAELVDANAEHAKLTWTDNATNETGYAVYASDHKGLTYQKVLDLPANTESVVVEGLVPGSLYSFRVQAVGNDKDSYLSDKAELKLNLGTPQDYFWVENGGNFEDLNHWAIASGSSDKHYRLPAHNDNIIFDANSFTKERETILIEDNLALSNVDMMAVANRPEITTANDQIEISVYGALKIPAGVTGRWRKLYLKSEKLDTELSFASPEIIYDQLIFEGSGSWKLVGDVYGTDALMNQGTLSLGKHKLSILKEFIFGEDKSLLRKLNLESGIFEVGSWKLSWDSNNKDTNLQFDAGTSTLRVKAYGMVQAGGDVYEYGASFYGGGVPYYNVEFETGIDRKSPILINGSNTFNKLKFVPGTKVEIFTGDQTFNKLEANGKLEARITIVNTDQRHRIDPLRGDYQSKLINNSSDNVTVEYCKLANLEAVQNGGLPATTKFIAINSADLGNIWSNPFNAEEAKLFDRNINWDFQGGTEEQDIDYVVFQDRDDNYIEDEISVDINGIREIYGNDIKSSQNGGLKLKVLSGPGVIDGNLLKSTGEPGLVELGLYAEATGSHLPSDVVRGAFVVFLDRNKPNEFVNFMQAKHTVGAAESNILINNSWGKSYFSIPDNSPKESQSVTPIPTSVKVSAKGVVAVASQNADRVLLWKQPPLDPNEISLGDADIIIGQSQWESKQWEDDDVVLDGAGNIAFSPDGNMLAISCRGTNRVLIYKSMDKLYEIAEQRKQAGGVPFIKATDADIVLGRPDFNKNRNVLPASDRTFNDPKGLLFTDDGKFLVCDGGNSRVMIFNEIPESHFASADVALGQPDFTSNTGALGRDKLNDPSSLAIANDGRLIVADAQNSRVLVYNSIPNSNAARADIVIGQQDFISGDWGSGPKNFSWPYGVAVDANNRLAVAEFGSNRVVVYNEIPRTNYAAADVVLGQPNFNTKYNKGGYNNSGDGNIWNQDKWNQSESFMKRVLVNPFEPDFDMAGRLYTAGWDMNMVKVFGAEAYTGDVAITLVTSEDRPSIGDEFDLTITLTNNGSTTGPNRPAFNLNADYKIPDELEVVGTPVISKGGYDEINRQWSMDELVHTEVQTMTVKVRLKSEFASSEVRLFAKIRSMSLMDTDNSNNTAELVLNKKKEIKIIPGALPVEIVYGMDPFLLSATTEPANLGGISYRIVQGLGDPLASLDANEITVLKPGNLIIEYIFAGNQEYKKKIVSQQIEIKKADLKVLFNWPIANEKYKLYVDHAVEYDILSKIPDGFDIPKLVIEQSKVDDLESKGVASFNQTKDTVRFLTDNRGGSVDFRFSMDPLQAEKLTAYFNDRWFEDVRFFLGTPDPEVTRTLKWKEAIQATYPTFDPIPITAYLDKIFMRSDLTESWVNHMEPTVTLITGEGTVVKTKKPNRTVTLPDGTTKVVTGQFIHGDTNDNGFEDAGERYYDEAYDSENPTNGNGVAIRYDYAFQPNDKGRVVLLIESPKFGQWEGPAGSQTYVYYSKISERIEFEITGNGLKKTSEITAFSIPEMTGSATISPINEQTVNGKIVRTATIDLEASSDLNLNNVVPTVIHNGFSIRPADGQALDLSQTNGVKNFIVRAEDSDYFTTYTLTIDRKPSTSTQIDYFEVNGNREAMILTNGYVAVEVDPSVDLSDVHITLGIPVEQIGKMSISPLSNAKYDFSSGNPIYFTVTAEDGITKEAYGILVTHTLPDAAAKLESIDINGETVLALGSDLRVKLDESVDLTNVSVVNPVFRTKSGTSPRLKTSISNVNLSNPYSFFTTNDEGVDTEYTIYADVQKAPGANTVKVFRVKDEVSNVIDDIGNTINVEVPITTDLTRVALQSIIADDLAATLELSINGLVEQISTPQYLNANQSIRLKVSPTNGGLVRDYQVNIERQSNKLPANLVVTPNSMTFTFGDAAQLLTIAKDTDAPLTANGFDTNILTYDETSGAVTPVGVGSTTISFITPENTTYKKGSFSASIEVKEATYTLETNPSATAIEVGQQVGVSILSGESVKDVNDALVSGSFVFVDPTEVATVQEPKTVSVKFVPTTADGNYLELTSTVTITVNPKTKVDPVVTFPSLSDITYGTALDNSLFENGNNNGILGTFEIDASQNGNVLDAGSPSVKVSFVADDLTTYNKVSKDVSILVNPATYTLETNPTATAIEVGEQLGTSTLSGESVKDVNDALVLGSFVFVDPTEVATVQEPKTVSVKFVPTTANGNYLELRSTVTITVNPKTKVDPIVTFPSLSDITYGTALDNSLFENGNNNGILGTFEIDASQDGSMLGAGTPSVKVWFVADDLTTYNKVFANVNITINKAVYTLETSPSATAIEVGQQVGVSALSGGSVKDINDAVVLGSFEFVNPTDVATAQEPKTVSVKFVPTRADGNYLELTSTVTITVNPKTKVDPIVTFPSLKAITYGAVLENNLLKDGDDNGIAGSFEIDASQDGSMLGAGTPSVKVWFVADDLTTYNKVFANVNITINKAVYTLETSPSATAIEVGQQVGVSALSGGSVKDINDAVVLGSFEFVNLTELATAEGPKTVFVKFVPTTANGNYLEFTSRVDVQVNAKTKVNPVVTFPSLSDITYGTALGNNLLKDGDDNGIAGSFEIDASQDGNVLDAGTKPVKVWFVADDLTTYNKVFANVNITINKAVYTLETSPSATAIEVGQQVGVSTLSGGSVKDVNDVLVSGSFEFVNLTELATAEGPKTVSVKFVPTTADGNYLELTSTVTITVNPKTKVDPVVIFPNLKAITYGAVLENNLLKDGNDNGIAGSFEIDASQDGSVLDAGTPSVKVWFKPTATDTYNEVFENVNITVNPATYTLVTNPTATAIEVGQQVGTSRLSGSVKDVSGVAVLGSFEFVNPTEEATVQESKTVSVKFVPTTVDGNYSELRLTVTITVNPKTKVNPVVTFPSLKAITYGAVLENNLLKDGDDNGIAGSFEIDASQDGSVLDAGTPSVKVWFKPTATETYNEVFENVNITINKAVYTLETTPSATAIEVGQQVGVSTLSGSVKDVNDALVLGSFVFVDPTEVATVEGPKMVSVKFVPTTADGNYLEFTSTVTVQVDPNLLTLTVRANAQTKVYGETESEFTYTVRGLVNGDTESDVLEGTLSRVTGEDARTYGITQGSLSVKTGKLYTINFVGADFEITKATLRAKAKDATRVYGDDNPVFEIEYAGFINGEDSDDLTTKPTGISLADKSSILGNYDIMISGGVSTNYAFEYGSGTLEIEKGTPEVTVWPSLSEITFGEALTEVIFTGGSATVEGTYAIVNASRRLSEGTHDVDLIFTPSDLNYNKVSGQSKVKVGKRVIRDNALIVSLDIKKHNSETSLLASEHEVVIDKENLTIEATVYEGVDLSKVNLAIGFKDVNSNPIVSPSENRKVDLTDLSETITVNNGEDALVVYTLKVKTVAAPEPIILSITSFEISGSIDVQINESEKRIAVKMPKGSDLTNLVPSITLASEKSKVSPNTGLAQDFSNGSISYVVSGAGEEVSYKVSVTAESDVVLGPDDLLDMDLKAYPNPTSGKITLNLINAKTKKFVLSLSDFNGRILKVQNIDSDKTVLDITNLNTGIYLLSVTSETYTKSIKVVKR